MNAKEKIVAVHLLNDFSGSPLVFSQALEALQEDGHEIILHTTRGHNGFLNRIKVEIKHVPYKFFANTFMRLAAFLSNQVILFWQVLQYRRQPVIIYINTLLPFGAALAGKLTRKKVVYHLHESYIKPLPLKLFLKKAASLSADKAIYVSGYLQEAESLHVPKGEVVYNSLPHFFIQRASQFTYSPHRSRFTVLMICSLKTYKGIFEYIDLAVRHPGINFELVMNAAEHEIVSFFGKYYLPSNLLWFAAQNDLDPFYRRTDLVVNLTNPALCIETFGMTILEAMVYGIPVIAPPFGGPAEIVTHGVNGFLVDVRNTTALDACMLNLSGDKELCLRLSQQSRITAAKFSDSVFKRKVKSIFSF